MDCQAITTQCILGLAVGDALGVPYEFLPREQAERAEPEHMQAGGSFHEQPAGAWSDDTAMALASLDSLTRCRGFCAEDMMAAFVDWYRNAAYTSTGVTFGVGGTVGRAICSAMGGLPALSCGRSGVRDNGNGALMRIAPVSLWCAFHALGREEELRLVSQACSLTHGHAISRLGCLIYTDYLKALLGGADKRGAYRAVCSAEYSRFFPASAVDAYARVLDGGLPELPRCELRESGYVVDTLEAALWATLRSSSYREAVCEAIRLGYDTDTAAAVTGSLCGLLYGLDGIPQTWRDELLRRPYLEELCRRFARALA